MTEKITVKVVENQNDVLLSSNKKRTRVSSFDAFRIPIKNIFKPSKNSLAISDVLTERLGRFLVLESDKSLSRTETESGGWETMRIGSTKRSKT